MIFQDPMTSLNPYLTIAAQMVQVVRAHERVSANAARSRCIEMLEAVAIPEAAARFDRYPHELSGGMRQRVMIATSLLLGPQILIADEPTTALDVTVQAQILELMKDLKRRFGTSIILITHDLGVIAGLADRVLVMHGGELKEQGTVDDLFYRPRHDYTRALLAAVPRLDAPLAAHARREPVATRGPRSSTSRGSRFTFADVARPESTVRSRLAVARMLRPSTASISRSRRARRSESSASQAAASRRSRARS